MQMTLQLTSFVSENHSQGVIYFHSKGAHFRKEMICETSLEVAMYGDGYCQDGDLKIVEESCQREVLREKYHTLRAIYEL
jgi:hypothetical protein